MVTTEMGQSDPSLSRLAVSGSRTYTDRQAVYRTLDRHAAIIMASGSILRAHVGDARGTDNLALDWARDRRVPRIVFFASARTFAEWQMARKLAPDPLEGGTLVADWDRDGRSAGPFRNTAMIRGCQLLIAFYDCDWQDTEISKLGTPGTRNAIATARNMRIPAYVYFKDGRVEHLEHTGNPFAAVRTSGFTPDAAKTA